MHIGIKIINELSTNNKKKYFKEIIKNIKSNKQFLFEYEKWVRKYKLTSEFIIPVNF